MIKNLVQYLISAVVMIALLNGCAGTVSSTPSGMITLSFKDYPDHAFNPRGYVRGMKKGGHNLLIWQDPSVDLTRYSSVNVSDFGGRLLPAQDRFSYTPFIKNFNLNFQNVLKITQEESQNVLCIVGELVECNPGSRAARILVGLGAGKAAGAVACEVYEPDQSKPCMRIYARDTSSFGTWGGDSVSFLNHIFSLVIILPKNWTRY